ncbi:MAG: NADH:ubiquinone reductase (Na(+)-transporting) subunit B [Cytophagales bacterium]|nr:NADH:ubiquinone reductase (Na(+)-transporting) subunit B [Cytophagales bacterium]
MKFLQKKLHEIKPHFEKGGKYEKFYYPFEAIETFLFSPADTVPNKGAHIRDAIDLKRLMSTVIVAMLPCLLFGMYNAGFQHYKAIGQDAEFMEMFLLGARLTMPIVVVAYAAGLGVEFIFSIVRKHPVNEGYLVSGMLIPLIMPVTIPLWQVALASIFAVLIGKEVFGGTGMNVLNVALTARAFLYFAYPTDISGEVWTYFGDAAAVDGYSGATALAVAASSTGDVVQSLGSAFSFENLFYGFVPGSIGETSALACILGALLLIFTGTGSGKIMIASVLGALGMGFLFNVWGATPFMEMPAHYHLVLGGFMFGVVFMATDPVTASHTEKGKWIYGILIGVLTVIIRVINPAYPEGIMLAILIMNVFAPLIDHYIIQANKNRRLRRATV